MSEMSNNEWELVQKVKLYRNKALEVLKKGGSFEELAQITDMGMNLRIALIREAILSIFTDTLDISEKAQLIAEKLIEV